MSEPITVGVGSTSIVEKIEAVGRWVNIEALPLLRALRGAVNDLILAPPELRETSGPTDIPMGAVADGQFLMRSGSAIVGGSPGASTDGSIFSMVGPLGAETPVVAYDFTVFDGALTTAQNLTNANQSGVPTYDLVAAGTPTYTYSAFSGGPSQVPKAIQPFSARTDGGALFTSATNYAETAIHPPGLLLQAALTLEWCGYFPLAPTASHRLLTFAGSGGTATDNWQYSLFWGDVTKAWGYYHETGIHGGSSVNLLTTSNAAETQSDQPRMITLTRSAAGLVTLYMNGRKAANSNTASLDALPTGGSTSKLRIGYTDATSLVTIGARLFESELTAAQVRESYRRTFFGVGA